MSYYELRYTVNGRDIGNYNSMNDDKDEDDKKKMNEEDDNQDLNMNEEESGNEPQIQKNMNKNKNKNEESHINRHDRVAYRLPNDKVYEMVIALKNPIYKIKCISFQTKPFNYY